jgi:hypothetical protein
MAGYKYRGKDTDPLRAEPVIVEQVRTSKGTYLSTRVNDVVLQRALIKLRDNHDHEYRRILAAIHHALGPTGNSRKETTHRNNIARAVLRRKYPRELDALKEQVRPEVYKEFNYTPRPVGKNGRKGAHEELIERLVRKDFT